MWAAASDLICRRGDVYKRQELDRLTGAHYLTEAQAQAVDPAAVARFFAGDLGRQLRGSRNLHREYPFSVLTEARRFFPQAPAGEMCIRDRVRALRRVDLPALV